MISVHNQLSHRQQPSRQVNERTSPHALPTSKFNVKLSGRPSFAADPLIMDNSTSDRKKYDHVMHPHKAPDIAALDSVSQRLSEEVRRVTEHHPDSRQYLTQESKNSMRASKEEVGSSSKENHVKREGTKAANGRSVTGGNCHQTAKVSPTVHAADTVVRQNRWSQHALLSSTSHPLQKASNDNVETAPARDLNSRRNIATQKMMFKIPSLLAPQDMKEDIFSPQGSNSENTHHSQEKQQNSSTMDMHPRSVDMRQSFIRNSHNTAKPMAPLSDVTNKVKNTPHITSPSKTANSSDDNSTSEQVLEPSRREALFLRSRDNILADFRNQKLHSTLSAGQSKTPAAETGSPFVKTKGATNHAKSATVSLSPTAYSPMLRRERRSSIGSNANSDAPSLESTETASSLDLASFVFPTPPKPQKQQSGFQEREYDHAICAENIASKGSAEITGTRPTPVITPRNPNHRFVQGQSCDSPEPVGFATQGTPIKGIQNSPLRERRSKGPLYINPNLKQVDARELVPRPENVSSSSDKGSEKNGILKKSAQQCLTRSLKSPSGGSISSPPPCPPPTEPLPELPPLSARTSSPILQRNYPPESNVSLDRRRPVTGRSISASGHSYMPPSKDRSCSRFGPAEAKKPPHPSPSLLKHSQPSYHRAASSTSAVPSVESMCGSIASHSPVLSSTPRSAQSQHPTSNSTPRHQYTYSTPCARISSRTYHSKKKSVGGSSISSTLSSRSRYSDDQSWPYSSPRSPFSSYDSEDRNMYDLPGSSVSFCSSNFDKTGDSSIVESSLNTSTTTVSSNPWSSPSPTTSASSFGGSSSPIPSSMMVRTMRLPEKGINDASKIPQSFNPTHGELPPRSSPKRTPSPPLLTALSLSLHNPNHKTQRGAATSRSSADTLTPSSDARLSRFDDADCSDGEIVYGLAM